MSRKKFLLPNIVQWHLIRLILSLDSQNLCKFNPSSPQTFRFSPNFKSHSYLLYVSLINFYWQLLTESSLQPHVWLTSGSCLLSYGNLWMWQWGMDAGHENGWNKGYTMLIFSFLILCWKKQNLISTYPKEGDILLHLKLMACKTTTFLTFIYNTTSVDLRKSCCPFLF